MDRLWITTNPARPYSSRMSAHGDGLTRRQFVARAAGLAAGLALPGPVWAASARASADPRLRALDRAVRGPVLTPPSATYAQARLVFDALYDGIHPLAVVQPLDAADVAAVVKWAKTTGVHIIARSGGQE